MSETIKTYPEMNEMIKDLLRIGNTPDGLYAAQRIEELEIQLKTAGVRAVIEAYDRGGMEGDAAFNIIQDLLSGYEPEFGGGLPEEWMNQIASIWAEWDEEDYEDPDYSVKSDHYIDRIRVVIGMPKPAEEYSR